MTKTVEYFVDLTPGWQDMQYAPYFLSISESGGLLPDLPNGATRVRVMVEFPCIGGSALATETVKAQIEEVRDR